MFEFIKVWYKSLDKREKGVLLIVVVVALAGLSQYFNGV